MITRKTLHFGNAIRFAWKNLLYSGIISTTAYFVHRFYSDDYVSILPVVVAILGTALAIIMAFRNASAYERCWSARSLWANVASESRTFTRQALTVVDPDHIPGKLLQRSYQLVRGQIGWVQALRLQLKDVRDESV